MPWAPPTDTQLRRQRHPQTAPQRDYRAEDARRKADPALAQAARLRSSARWQRLRRLVLSRAPLCADIWGTHAAQGRVEPAVEVDHIQELAIYPALAFDERNLQPLCAACHARKTARERRHLHDVWLVCGPPAAGKSSYVRQQMLPGDMVLDFDRLLGALSGRDWDGAREWSIQTDPYIRYVWAAYDAVVALMAKRLTQASSWQETAWTQPRTWVLGTLPERQRRRTLAERIGARCLMLAVPADVCLAHVASDPQRCHDVERWRGLITEWWARYEPDAQDELIVSETA